MPKGKRKEINKAWGKNEDLKLHRLFRLRNDRDGVDSRDLTQKSVKVVQEKHFTDRPYKNFAPLFSNKARRWNLNNALLSARLEQGKIMTLLLINFVFIVFNDFFNCLKIRTRTTIATTRKTTVPTVKVGTRRATKTISAVWLTILPS